MRCLPHVLKETKSLLCTIVLKRFIMDPALFCRVFFSLGTAVAIGGTFIPSFRQQIMNYGPRQTPTQITPGKEPKNIFTNLFEYIASFQVPHTWFTHYYAVSVSSSIFWAVQIITHGRAFEFLLAQSKQAQGNMTVNQVFLAWMFMAVQGGRRLYETIILTKPSQARMWVGLWAVGIAFYLVMGISVFIEGIGKQPKQSYSEMTNFPASLNYTGPLTSVLDVSKPSLKTFIAVLIFIIGSGIQHDCHIHLASLKKYTLPHHYMFQAIICPHYTSECLIYVAIAIVAAPTGQVFNKTVLAAIGFVASNLAVTADSTRQWWIEKFGAEALEGRWRMVPYIY